MKSEDLISKWDDFLKKGNIDGVKNSLPALYKIKIERHHRQPIASLLRRAGCYNTGLKVLDPALFLKDRSERKDVKNRDWAEYALLLSEIGIPQQALAYFDRVESQQVPMKDLYMAFCFFKMWDYETAEEYLLNYVGSTMISDYERLVGKVNLLAALIENTKLQRAERIITELKPSIMGSEKDRLKSNFLELEAQFYIHSEDPKRALELLQEAANLAQKNQERDGLYIRKWLAYLQSQSRQSLSPLDHFAEEARRFHEWESLRDCEFLKLKVKFDPQRFSQLYVGTPKEAYRKRLLRSFTQMNTPPDVAELGDADQLNWMDALNAQYKGSEVFALGRPLHHLFYNLCSDFYAAQPVGALFHSTFPDEFYDPNSSPNRIHQLVFRLRGEIFKKKIGMQIAEFDGTYRLELAKGTGLRMERMGRNFGRESIVFQRLLQKNCSWPLRSHEVAAALDISKPTAVRYIRYWLSQGWLKKQGEGPETQYRAA